MELVLQRPQRKESVKKYSVLYVDDEPVNLRIFQHAFKRDYNIFTALNGFDALEILNDKHVDLIITDQQMPRMSGVDLLAKIVPKHPNIVRMIMTGFSDIGAIIRAVNEFGLDKYLVKPWDRDQLKVEFDKALEKKENEDKVQKVNGAEDSVVMVNDSLLPREADLQQYLKNSFIIYDKSAANSNSYWFGEKEDNIILSSFNTSESSASLIGLKSFLNLCLIESVYKNVETKPSDILSQVLHKIKGRYNDSAANLGSLSISIITLNKNSQQLSFSGVNQDVHYFDSESEIKTLTGEKESFDIKSSEVPDLINLKAEGVSEAYLISRNILNQIVSSDNGSVEGISFIQFMNRLQGKSMKDQSLIISEKLSGENAKCMIGMSLK